MCTHSRPSVRYTWPGRAESLSHPVVRQLPGHPFLGGLKSSYSGQTQGLCVRWDERTLPTGRRLMGCPEVSAQGVKGRAQPCSKRTVDLVQRSSQESSDSAGHVDFQREKRDPWRRWLWEMSAIPLYYHGDLIREETKRERESGWRSGLRCLSNWAGSPWWTMYLSRRKMVKGPGYGKGQRGQHRGKYKGKQERKGRDRGLSVCGGCSVVTSPCGRHKSQSSHGACKLWWGHRKGSFDNLSLHPQSCLNISWCSNGLNY